VDGKVFNALKLPGTPVSLILDKQGKILWEHVGAFENADEVFKEIKGTLKPFDYTKSQETSSSFPPDAVKEYNNLIFLQLLQPNLNKEKLAQLYNNRGITYEKLEMYREAIDDYNEALRYVENQISYYNRAVAFAKLNKKKEMIRDMKKAASLGDKQAQDYLKRKNIR